MTDRRRRNVPVPTENRQREDDFIVFARLWQNMKKFRLVWMIGSFLLGALGVTVVLPEQTVAGVRHEIKRVDTSLSHKIARSDTLQNLRVDALLPAIDSLRREVNEIQDIARSQAIDWCLTLSRRELLLRRVNCDRYTAGARFLSRDSMP